MLVEAVSAAGKPETPTFDAGPTGMNHPAEKGGVTPDRGNKPAHAPRLFEMVDDIQNALTMIHNVDLRFHVHQASGKVVVTVTDEATGKVIREIPPRDALDLAERLDEMIGLLFDQKG